MPAVISRSNCAKIASLDTASFSVATHLMLSASKPCFACQYPSATTATDSTEEKPPIRALISAAGSLTTSTTPFTARVSVSSIFSTPPPKVGARLTVAYSILGTRTSRAKVAVPSTLLGRSCRWTWRPIILNWSGVFSMGDAGGVISAAAAANVE